MNIGAPLTRTPRLSDSFRRQPEANLPKKCSKLGVFLPNPVQPADYHSDESAAAVVAVNKKLADLAAEKTAIESENHAFKCSAAEDLTDKQIKDHGKIGDRALNLVRAAMDVAGEVAEVLKLAQADARVWVAACDAELQRVTEDWHAKMIATGHYLDVAYSNKEVGGINGWHGRVHNSILIAEALAAYNTAKTRPNALQTAINLCADGREHNRGVLVDARSMLSAF